MREIDRVARISPSQVEFLTGVTEFRRAAGTGPQPTTAARCADLVGSRGVVLTESGPGMHPSTRFGGW